MNFAKLFFILSASLLISLPAKGAVITYTVTSGASASLTSGGDIFDGVILVGTWSSTLSGQTIASAATGQGALTAFTGSTGNVTAFVTTANSAPLLGVGIRMNPFAGGADPGIANYTLSYSATITNSSYSLVNSFVSGALTPGSGNYGTTFTNNLALAAGNTNSLTFSGFLGNATLTDATNNNLVQADGATLTSGGVLNWNPGSNPAGDTPTAQTNWYVTIPTLSATTITYAVDFGTGTGPNGTVQTNAYNESTAFGFEIVPVPEPSTTILLGLGAFALLALRRRSVR